MASAPRERLMRNTPWSACVRFCFVKGKLNQLWSRQKDDHVEYEWREVPEYSSMREATDAASRK